MKCKKATKMISAYLDGELSESSQNELRRHLRKCRDCREELDELRQLSDYLDAVPGTEFRVSFAHEVREKAEQEKATSKIVPFGLLDDLSRFSQAAAVLVAIGVGLVLGAFMSQSVATADAARQASSTATEQAEEMTEMDYHIQALSATPVMSLEQAYISAGQTTESGAE